MPILTVLCYILFVLAAIVLIVVVLLQDRGGGFGEALGVHGRRAPRASTARDRARDP